jgi:hypothetical protein
MQKCEYASKLAQVLAKEYECMTCHAQIRISKIDNVAPDAKKKWNKFELDGVTPHVCRSNNAEQRQQQHYDLSKEIMTIKAQLLAAVNRLDYVEKNL